MFKRREGTSGISGHLYETKLLSLLYFRAIYDERIIEFQLASNVDNIGAFDDICFKFKIKGCDKPILVFIQAKHRENKKQILKINFATYFIDYLKIRQQFKPSNKDLFFKGTFDEAECLFVLYTTARDGFSNDSKVESNFCSILNDLISTGGTAKHTYKQEDDVEFLSKVAMREQMTTLAEQIAKFINNDSNFQILFNEEIVLQYHVILAHKVVVVSELQPNGHRIASFRHDFFDTNEEYLTIFKISLFNEILKRRKIESTCINDLLSEFLAEPTDASKLSKLIGTVITYRNGQLELEEQAKKKFRLSMKPTDVSRLTVNKAVELAAKEILLSQKFKVPAAFGNKDITLSGSIEKKKKRIKYLTSKITGLLDEYKASKIVTVDESLGDGFLQLNGGVGGAIGNLFVLDDNSKLLKITDNTDSLGNLAKSLFESLIDEIGLINKKRSENKIPNLCEYKFCFKVNKFSKLLFQCTEYEENLARDFLKKLIIYSNQADEKGVEKILKDEVEEHQQDHLNYFQVQTDAIFSKYHDDIQKWWMQPGQALYLTRESDLFEKAKKKIVKDPLLRVINAMYRNHIKHIDYTFTEDAVRSLNLQEQHSSAFIITENSVLTIIKVIEHLIQHNIKDPVILDLKYIVKLPPKDRKLLRKELTDTNEDEVLILVCDDIQNDKKKILENILEAILNKKTFVITNHASVEILKQYFAIPPVYDVNNNLIDISEESQKSILERGRVMFQGTEVRLKLIVGDDDESKVFVKGDVLHKIINEETIAIGKLNVNRNYDKIKHLYVDRCVQKTKPVTDTTFEKSHLLKTLFDVDDEVVLVTAEPGMGKSTLLTHLSIKTKELKPEVWIIRIDLLACSAEFSKWKKEETTIDLLEVLKFICQVMLREKLGNENKVEITLGEKDNVMYLKHCTADAMTEFELNLFLHFYSHREIIFLFDGFDEISPHYTGVVMKCFKTVRNDCRKHRMWITTRPYDKLKTKLEEEFGLSYKINYFSNKETIKYLQTFWEFNLRLEELNSTQLENVKKFLEHMSAVNKERTIPNLDHQMLDPPDHQILYQIFKNAALYISSEIKNISLWKYKNDTSSGSNIRAMDSGGTLVDKHFCDVNPLIMYLTAVYVQHNIKKDSKKSETWYLDIETYTVYEGFLENKIKRQYEEKNGMNICMPDVIISYEKELADSIFKHKILGAYAIFGRYQCSIFFSSKDLKEIDEMIKLVNKGEEKTGLICSAPCGIPIFIHRTFAEYFAVEYICDCLKNLNITGKFIYFEAMFTAKQNVRKIFHHKMNTDKILASISKIGRYMLEHWLQKKFHGQLLLPEPENFNTLRSFLGIIAENEKNNPFRANSQDSELPKLYSFFLNYIYQNRHHHHMFSRHPYLGFRI